MNDNGDEVQEVSAFADVVQEDDEVDSHSMGGAQQSQLNNVEQDVEMQDECGQDPERENMTQTVVAAAPEEEKKVENPYLRQTRRGTKKQMVYRPKNSGNNNNYENTSSTLFPTLEKNRQLIGSARNQRMGHRNIFRPAVEIPHNGPQRLADYVDDDAFDEKVYCDTCDEELIKMFMHEHTCD